MGSNRIYISRSVFSLDNFIDSHWLVIEPIKMIENRSKLGSRFFLDHASIMTKNQLEILSPRKSSAYTKLAGQKCPVKIGRSIESTDPSMSILIFEHTDQFHLYLPFLTSFILDDWKIVFPRKRIRMNSFDVRPSKM